MHLTSYISYILYYRNKSMCFKPFWHCSLLSITYCHLQNLVLHSALCLRIKNLLQMSPKDRYTAEQALNDASWRLSNCQIVNCNSSLGFRVSEFPNLFSMNFMNCTSHLSHLALYQVRCRWSRALKITCIPRFGSRRRLLRPRMWICRPGNIGKAKLQTYGLEK